MLRGVAVRLSRGAVGLVVGDGGVSPVAASFRELVQRRLDVTALRRFFVRHERREAVLRRDHSPVVLGVVLLLVLLVLLLVVLLAAVGRRDSAALKNGR